MSEIDYQNSVLAIDKLLDQIKEQTSTCIKSAIVALYTADQDNPLRFSGFIGILHLDKDRLLKTAFFRIYDLQSLVLLFEVELYFGFAQNYRKITQTFYIFDYFAQGIIGFQFKSQQDAQMMKIKVKIASQPLFNYQQLKQKEIKKSRINKKSQSIYGRIKNRLSGIFIDQINQQQIILNQTEIIKVQRNKSIVYNYQTQSFDLENIPPQWEELFYTMNISKKSLKDKNVAKFIVEEAIISDNNQINQNNLQIKQQFMSQQSPNGKEKFQQNQQQANRSNLMNQIENYQFKLKPIKKNQKGYQLDISSMNKQQRHDFAQYLRQKLQRRKQEFKTMKIQQQQDFY